MELGSYFLFLQEQIKDIIIICTRVGSNNGNPLETGAGAVSQDEKAPSASWAKPWLVEKEYL